MLRHQKVLYIVLAEFEGSYKLTNLLSCNFLVYQTIDQIHKSTSRYCTIY